MHTDPSLDAIEPMLDRAFAALDQGLMDQAQAGFQAVLQVAPQQFDALHMLGVIAMQRRDFATCIRLIAQALTVDPDFAMAQLNIGIAYMESHHPDQAVAHFDKAIALEPAYAKAHFGRGAALLALKQWEGAIASLDQTLAQQPGNAEAHFNRGNALLELKRAEEAVSSYNQCLALQPQHVSALINRGHAYLALKRYDEAIASCNQAIALQGDRPAAFSGRADAYQALRRHDEAIASYEQSLQIQPDQVAVLVNLGGALRDAGRGADALMQCERALDLAPHAAEAHMNRGNALLDMGQLHPAREAFAKVCTLQPDNANAQWAQGWADLLAGDWERGLPQLEWRWKKSTFTSPPRAFTQPLWLGSPDLRGHTILLHAEQGLGDTLHFCRYVPMVMALGAQVVLEVQPALKTLMTTLHPQAQVCGQGEGPLPAFDYHCPLMSLPLAFNSTPASLPAMPAYLRANPGLTEVVGQRLTSRLGDNKQPRIGLVWSGNAAHSNDHHRSLSLATLLSTLPPEAQYFCLQKDIRPADLATLKTRPDVQHWPDELQTFDGTAALIDHMDWVISVDTSIAHLAGALGKPTWILLSHMPDWRWLLKRQDSPWYPSARLFRQTTWGQWDAPLTELGQALKAELALRQT